MDRGDYRLAGTLTTLTPGQLRLVEELEPEPHVLGHVAQGLLTLPELATAAGVASERLDERNVRPVAEILRIALDLSDAPLERPRSATRRVVGTCRHFAVLFCALLRAKGIPARARCGFATYFQPGLHVDHWVTEYWHNDERRWVRVDSEILGFGFVERPDDLAPGEFLAGGEAWRLCRDGERDPMSFGVHGTDNWGLAEVVGNTIRDLAGLNKVEMLPWDEWGPMRRCYDGDIDHSVEQLMDAVADACIGETSDIVTLYTSVRVPDELIE